MRIQRLLDRLIINADLHRRTFDHYCIEGPAIRPVCQLPPKITSGNNAETT
jgi:hypothetical protein